LTKRVNRVSQRKLYRVKKWKGVKQGDRKGKADVRRKALENTDDHDFIILTDTEEYVHEDTEILEGVHHLTDQTNTYNSSKQDIIRTSAERKIMENAM
jgi:hypothetical protein